MPTTIERIDRLVGDPVPGRWYMVPCVFGTWSTGVVGGPELRFWPVIGGLHRDPEYFQFDTDHYHLDQRFLTIRHSDWGFYGPELSVSASPLQTNDRINKDGLPKPQLRRRLCRRASFDMRDFQSKASDQLARMAADHPRAIRGKRGWICPHKKYDMASVSFDAEGNITCPMHGLKFCARTGRTIRGPHPQAQLMEVAQRAFEAATDGIDHSAFPGKA